MDKTSQNVWKILTWQKIKYKREERKRLHLEKFETFCLTAQKRRKTKHFYMEFQENAKINLKGVNLLQN